MRVKIGFASMALWLCGCAAQPWLTVKPGLWERTTITRNEGGPRIALPDLRQVPPEQRARIERMLSARLPGGSTSSTTRECVTPELLQNWDALVKGDRHDATCERNVVEQSSQRLKVTLTCEGGNSTGDVDYAIRALDRVDGRVDMTRRTEAGDRKVSVASSMKWLGDDCGDIRPVSPAGVPAR